MWGGGGGGGVAPTVIRVTVHLSDCRVLDCGVMSRCVAPCPFTVSNPGSSV